MKEKPLEFHVVLLRMTIFINISETHEKKDNLLIFGRSAIKKRLDVSPKLLQKVAFVSNPFKAFRACKSLSPIFSSDFLYK